jgi:hypothetical protein
MSGARGVAKAAALQQRLMGGATPSPPPAGHPQQQQQTGPAQRPTMRSTSPPRRAVGGALSSSASGAHVGGTIVAVAPSASARASAAAAAAVGSSASSLSIAGSSYSSTRVLDLRSHSLCDLHVLHGKFPAARSAVMAYPWTVLLLSNNLLTRLEGGLARCTRLRKLDLSRNGINTLPKANFWKQMPQLQILLIHHNKIDSIHALQHLVRTHN